MRPTAGNAALRPDQKRSRSASLCEQRMSVAPLARITSIIFSISCATSSREPYDSARRIASASRSYPAFPKPSTALVASLSIIPTPAGTMPAPMIAATASPALSTSAKEATTTWASSGLGSSFTATSIVIASSPSDPVTSARRSNPGASSASLPRSSTSPSIVITRTFATLCTVSPYVRQWTPPEFSATLTPIEQASVPARRQLVTACPYLQLSHGPDLLPGRRGAARRRGRGRHRGAGPAGHAACLRRTLHRGVGAGLRARGPRGAFDHRRAHAAFIRRRFRRLGDGRQARGREPARAFRRRAGRPRRPLLRDSGADPRPLRGRLPRRAAGARRPRPGGQGRRRHVAGARLRRDRESGDRVPDDRDLL